VRVGSIALLIALFASLAFFLAWSRPQLAHIDEPVHIVKVLPAKKQHRGHL
jgi:hypothetical protein